MLGSYFLSRETVPKSVRGGKILHWGIATPNPRPLHLVLAWSSLSPNRLAGRSISLRLLCLLVRRSPPVSRRGRNGGLPCSHICTPIHPPIFPSPRVEKPWIKSPPRAQSRVLAEFRVHSGSYPQPVGLWIFRRVKRPESQKRFAMFKKICSVCRRNRQESGGREANI